jgi:hypothetical protein
LRNALLGGGGIGYQHGSYRHCLLRSLLLDLSFVGEGSDARALFSLQLQARGIFIFLGSN